jgi:hypothetical protein
MYETLSLIVMTMTVLIIVGAAFGLIYLFSMILKSEQ